jgi:hypothetical protein
VTRSGWLDEGVRRVPLLSGSRVLLVPAGDEDVVLRPPPPPGQVVNAAAAARDALRFPLSGPPLEALVPAGGSATVVVEPPALPLPGAQQDPRADAVAVALDELERCGIRSHRQTILVAGGLARRAARRDLERLLPPARARAFRGRVAVHDAEDERLVPLAGGVRVHPALVETDVVLVVSAAETVLHGGPGALLAACDAATVRRVAGADSLLAAAGTPEWRLALHVEAELARRVAVAGVSLVLDLPRFAGALRGYPHDAAALERVRRSWTRAAFSRLPAALRRPLLGAQRRLAATAAFAGPPSVAHAEAFLRGTELRGIRLDAPLDALVVGVPWLSLHAPREPVNPVTAAAIGLGLALRLYRGTFPLQTGGTLVLVHRLTRSFSHAQGPYAEMLAALRTAQTPDALADAEREAAAAPARQVSAYRAGRACHPLLPYADWAGCQPALSRLGRVIVAGARDAVAARALGFVPSRGIVSALEMAHGIAGGRARVGILLAPPYAPLLVG